MPDAVMLDEGMSAPEPTHKFSDCRNAQAERRWTYKHPRWELFFE
jgi:hypothetical protein